MLMDLHCHTLKKKSGDGGRSVTPEDFSKAIKKAGVKIVAITNHNCFDLLQFKDLQDAVGDDAILWPGVELDVSGNHSGTDLRGHVIVIADPRKVEQFSRIVSDLCSGDPDSFYVSMDALPSIFASLEGCLFVCHYMKKPGISKEDIDYLKANSSEDDLVVLEPSSARKAGVVVMDNDEPCWFGSDVKDWKNYPGGDPESVLPNCLFNITSFDRFVALLKKDNKAVLYNTVLSSKRLQTITVEPFPDLSLSLELYNDVNVIFGGKATGKTQILKHLEQHFCSSGKVVRTYYIEQKENDLQKLVDVPPDDATLSVFASHYSMNEFSRIAKWKWREIPSLGAFKRYHETMERSDTAKRLGICKATFSDSLDSSSLNQEIRVYKSKINTIVDYMHIEKKGYLTEEEIACDFSIVKKLGTAIKREILGKCIEYKAKCLERWTIDYLKKKIANATAIVSKPNSVGLNTFVEDYRDIKDAAKVISDNLEFDYKPPLTEIGELPLKGKVCRRLSIGFSFQPQPKEYGKTGGRRRFVKEGGTQKIINDVSRTILSIVNATDSNSISSAVSNAQALFKDEKITSLESLLNYSNFLQTDSCPDFRPSNGVTSVLLVDAVISDTKADVIIMDEPDGGMGSDFVNENLLPKILRRASENKVVIISTHDPNLVVRTHPYCCIYRVESAPDCYETYVGDSFSDDLIKYDDDSAKISWVEACITKCEGGEPAIKERERTYGYR